MSLNQRRFFFLCGTTQDTSRDLAIQFHLNRRDLRSSGTRRLVQPSVHRSTVGGRAFPVAGPQHFTVRGDVGAVAVEIFRMRLTIQLFTQSYPDMYLH